VLILKSGDIIQQILCFVITQMMNKNITMLTRP